MCESNVPQIDIDDFSALMFISTSDTTEYPEDTMSLPQAELSNIFNEFKIKSIKKAGYCDNLCGSTGIFLKITPKEKNNNDSISSQFIVDFGYGCNEAKEACIVLGDYRNAPCFVLSYGKATSNYLKKAWSHAISKGK